MPQNFSSEVEKIMGELPGAQAELNATETALRANERALGGLAGRGAELVKGYETAVSDATREHNQAVFESYDPRMQKILLLLGEGDDSDTAFPIPPAEACERVAHLDELVQLAAGQPIVITKPGEDWFDVGMLSDSDRSEQIGLRPSYDRQAGKQQVELPLAHMPLAVDVQTGRELRGLEDKHGELRRRTFSRPDSQMIRPIIDPLNTRIVISDVSPITEEDSVLTHVAAGDSIRKIIGENEDTDTEQETTYILIGYSAMHQVFNTILGFQPDDSEDSDDYMNFRQAMVTQERLQEVGIDFKADFIDGVLSCRIAALERRVEQLPTGIHERVELSALKSKRDELIADGLITV
jgi:hypothetical protein